MSGGSFNYLCFKDSDEILEYVDEFESMAGRVKTIEGAEKVTIQMDSMRGTMDEMRNLQTRLADMIDNLSDVWHAIEWHDSGDVGIDSVMVEVDKFVKLDDE